MKVFGLICLLFGASLAATTLDILADDPNMSTLVDLVIRAGLADAIIGGTFTIFAPTNDAFAKIPSADLTALGNDIPALTNVLKYHVVPNSIYKRDASNELQLATLNGQKIRFNIYSHNNAVTVQGSGITTFDKQASNGVIHVIDTVMMPPSGDIVNVVSKSGELSTLLQLVQQAGIADALKGDHLTLFAPTNAAFGKLRSSTIQQLKSDKNLLKEVLEYHVVPHTEYSKGIYNREYLRTLDTRKDRIIISEKDSAVRVNYNGNIQKADIGTTNGVIHEIDHVLIPARYFLQLAFGKK